MCLCGCKDKAVDSFLSYPSPCRVSSVWLSLRQNRDQRTSLSKVSWLQKKTTWRQGKCRNVVSLLKTRESHCPESLRNPTPRLARHSPLSRTWIDKHCQSSPVQHASTDITVNTDRNLGMLGKGCAASQMMTDFRFGPIVSIVRRS